MRTNSIGPQLSHKGGGAVYIIFSCLPYTVDMRRLCRHIYVPFLSLVSLWVNYNDLVCLYIHISDSLVMMV
jgi:hypothetical protein